jgi:hypothetical protein
MDAGLADDPIYEHYLQKLTTGSELIEHIFSDSWSGTSDRDSRIIRGLHWDMIQSKPFLFLGKLPRVILPRSVSFVLN